MAKKGWWARLYYAEGVTKRTKGNHQRSVSGELAIEVTNGTEAGLSMDIRAGQARVDIGRIAWGRIGEVTKEWRRDLN